MSNCPRSWTRVSSSIEARRTCQFAGRPARGRDVGALLLDPHQLLTRDVWMRDLAAAETHGELHLVAGFEKLPCGACLEVQVVVVGLRSELDLLDLHHALLALGLALLLLLLVLELAIVEDLADRRASFRVDLHQIEPLLACPVLGISGVHDA